MAIKQMQKSRVITVSTSSEKTPAPQSGTFQIGGDLPVHRLGFGAMRITGDGIWGEPRDHDEVIRVLRRALELGINFIDTADSYGPEVSERLIAEALYPYPKGLVIATKAGFDRNGPNQWTMNGRPEHLRAAISTTATRIIPGGPDQLGDRSARLGGRDCAGRFFCHADEGQPYWGDPAREPHDRRMGLHVAPSRGVLVRLVADSQRSEALGSVVCHAGTHQVRERQRS